MFNPKSVPWLKAGIKRFAEHGPSGINVNEMSAELSISKTSFYNFFGSKKGYVSELFEYWMLEGTMNPIRAAFAKENTSEIVRSVMRSVVFDNYQNEKFLSQLIGVQNSLPIAKKYIDEAVKLRMSFLLGVMSRMGLSDDEASKRARNLIIHSMGLFDYYFDKEPTKKEKEVIFNEIMELFWPEIIEK
jgi:AcrR family transcriptional regulator